MHRRSACPSRRLPGHPRPAFRRMPPPAPEEAAPSDVGPVLRAVGLGDTALVEGLLERSAAMVNVCLDRAIPLGAYRVTAFNGRLAC